MRSSKMRKKQENVDSEARAVEYLPTYLQQIGRFIPMTYAAQAIRDIMIRNATLGDLLLPISTLALTAGILYLVGVLLYRRWVEK